MSFEEADKAGIVSTMTLWTQTMWPRRQMGYINAAALKHVVATTRVGAVDVAHSDGHQRAGETADVFGQPFLVETSVVVNVSRLVRSDPVARYPVLGEVKVCARRFDCRESRSLFRMVSSFEPVS